MPAPRRKTLTESSKVAHENCWAKTLRDGGPGISVRDHCLNVGCVAEALLELLPPTLRTLLPSGAATLAALHDVGKISPGFQQKCDAWVLKNQPWFKCDAGYESRHQRVSQIFLESLDNGRLSRWAEAVGTHHGRVQGCDAHGELGGRAWEQARQDLLTALEHGFTPLPSEDARDEAAQWLLAGLITLADWLGSDEHNFCQANRGRLEKATQRAKADEIINRLELAGARLVGNKRFEQVFAERLNGEQPRPLQREIITAPKPEPGIYVIEDVMGSGKTEAALWLAYRLMTTGQARGLYFGLPTRVTSDRIHRRVREFLAEVYAHGVEPPLVHGQAWLKEMPSVPPAWKDSRDSSGDETPWEQVEASRKWFASARRGLLAPFAVGTVDQALLGVVAAKWFFLRQFALAGKVVVLDEVHSYDLYTGTLIQHLVKRLRELQATPVILSATLTATQRASLLGEATAANAADVPYPAITIKTSESASKLLPVEAHMNAKTIRVAPIVTPDFDHVTAVVSQAVELAAEGRNVVWIRNTVRHAQEAYRMLSGERQGDEFEIGLLHSRFAAFQRASYPKSSMEDLKKHHLHEERWLWMLGKPEPPRADARPKGCVLVATQVVEQSVDIDADVLITDLAPTDMLLQRIGRLHRHAERGDRGQATAYLVVPQAIAESSHALPADEIKKSLGSVGRVYAPYVLLRTWKEWQPLRDISLPTGIRRLLEDTYSDSNDDPVAWRELYDDLRAERNKLEKLALAATDVRGQPLRPDEEGLGTRFGGQRQLLLLMARSVSHRKDKADNLETIQLLNLHKLDFGNLRNFNLDAARQLHLNTATIPAWWLPRAIRTSLPPVLTQYFGEDVAMAVYHGERTDQLDLNTKDSRRAPVICYHPREGLWLEKRPDKRAIQEDYDGENEDGMF